MTFRVWACYICNGTFYVSAGSRTRRELCTSTFEGLRSWDAGKQSISAFQRTKQLLNACECIFVVQNSYFCLLKHDVIKTTCSKVFLWTPSFLYSQLKSQTFVSDALVVVNSYPATSCDGFRSRQAWYCGQAEQTCSRLWRQCRIE